MIRLAVAIATAGYIGYFPIASGTVGSAGGLLLYALLLPLHSTTVDVTVIVVLCAVGVWAGTTAEQFFGGIDPGPVVIDEVVGMLITMLFVPPGWAAALAGFFLFRLFDVIKPYPSSRFEHLPGGWGVMADDVMAAIYANLSLRALLYLAPGPAAAVDAFAGAAVVNAEIIAVGSELLTPSRIDTNSLFLTERLNEIGFSVQAKAIIGDDRARVAAAVRDALARVDLLVLTGGLGPTDDDVTRDAVADALNLPLDEDAAMVERMRERFAKRGLSMPEVNRRQAQVPRGATVLPNKLGTAPGLLLAQGPRLIALLPGPPRELQPMFEALVRDRLTELAGDTRLFRRVLKVVGRTESHVEEASQPLYSVWRTGPLPIETTILAAPGQVELHLTVAAPDAAAAGERLSRAVDELVGALGRDVFSADGRSMEEVVGDLLRARAMRIGIGESCSGGLIASRLTDVPGSSAYVLGSAVTYSNEAKVALLGVPADSIAAHGAVSEPVAAAMAAGARRVFGADIGVSATGIAGPDGGSDAKPVGTVCIAVVDAGGTPHVRTLHLFGNRQMIKFQTAQAALDFVRRILGG